LAAVTARYLMVDPRSSQAAYAIPDHLTHADAAVERFERWARENLSNGFSLTDASRATGTSPRTLALRLRACWASRRYPIFRILRVEHAVHLLQNKRQKRRANREGGRLFRCRHFAHPAAPSTRAQHIAIAQATRLTCSLSSVSGEGGEPAPLCTPAGLLLEVDVCERSIGTLGGQSGVPVPR
jgi:AraC-like DNA-binding protein